MLFIIITCSWTWGEAGTWALPDRHHTQCTNCKECQPIIVSRLRLPSWHLHPVKINIRALRWEVLAEALGSWWKVTCVGICLGFFVHATQSYLAEKHESSVVLSIREAVVGRFGYHIGKVYQTCSPWLELREGCIPDILFNDLAKSIRIILFVAVRFQDLNFSI